VSLRINFLGRYALTYLLIGGFWAFSSLLLSPVGIKSSPCDVCHFYRLFTLFSNSIFHHRPLCLHHRHRCSDHCSALGQGSRENPSHNQVQCIRSYLVAKPRALQYQGARLHYGYGQRCRRWCLRDGCHCYPENFLPPAA